MPTAVVRIDVNALPTGLTGLSRYPRAFLVFTDHGVPVAQAMIPLVDGAAGENALRDAFHRSAGWAYWRRRLHRELAWHDHATPAPGSVSATVAICTRERPDDLRRCLEAVTALPDDGQKVIVIDSGPRTDATRQVVGGFPSVRYVLEPTPGLDVARNRALREADTEIVAFTDDDAVPDPGWLRGHLANYDDPMVMAVTGLTLPYELETPAQELFERLSPFGRGFDRRVFGCPAASPLHVAPIGAGANMSLRRTVTTACGWFDEALDAGTATRSGGDHEMFSRMLVAGYRIVYDPTASSRHRHRRTLPELTDTFFGYGSGVFAFWTRRLLTERDYRAAGAAVAWYLKGPTRASLRSVLRRPGALPRSLAFAEWRGATTGPWAWLRARRRVPADRRRAARIPG